MDRPTGLVLDLGTERHGLPNSHRERTSRGPTRSARYYDPLSGCWWTWGAPKIRDHDTDRRRNPIREGPKGHAACGHRREMSDPVHYHDQGI